MYEMKDEFLTGIQSVDMEHAKLFEIANRAYETLMDEFISDKYDNIVNILSELKEYAASHFKHEEAYMESIHYKRLFTQKIEHAAFTEKLAEYDLNQLDENQRDAIVELLEFLNDWLVHHILENDILIGK